MQCAAEGARKRAALETYVSHEPSLRRTARRYSLCHDDAEDALQRALEILLTKAPSEDPRELIRWTHTVVKHEALAVRRERERLLSGPAARRPEPDREDWTALLASDADGPPERVERREAVARSREALQSLKPQELRALTLLAEGYSYVEIGEITGYSQTKINRCLAEGRARFRSFLARSEQGGRCEEMGALLSAFCDGEATREEAAAVREHLRACVACRATLRAYRAAPSAAAALAPALLPSRSLLERIGDALGDLAARLPGRGGNDLAVSQAAAGSGGGSLGSIGLAKTVAICAGGAAACVATGVAPAPLDLGLDRAPAPRLERRTEPAAMDPRGVDGAQAPEPARHAHSARRGRRPHRAERPPSAPASEPAPEAEPVVTSSAPEAAAEPEPVPVSEPSVTPPSASTGSAAGEFGP
jgi:RNA polymerase sigma factor (sigma-70 family)